MGRLIKLSTLFGLLFSFSVWANLCEKSCQDAQNVRIMSCFKNFQLCSTNPQNEDWCAGAFDDCKISTSKSFGICVNKCEVSEIFSTVEL